MSGIEWRPIAGYEGFYEVSNTGRVRSIARIVAGSNGRFYLRRGREIRPFASNKNYLRVGLSMDGKHTNFLVHRLVAITFIGTPEPGEEACHGDGNKQNNSVSNLRWASHSENELDKVRHGTHQNSAKTHCRYGHEFTPENTYTVYKPTGEFANVGARNASQLSMPRVTKPVKPRKEQRNDTGTIRGGGCAGSSVRTRQAGTCTASA